MQKEKGDEQPAAEEQPASKDRLRATDQIALSFMATITPTELQRCLFSDTLVAVSEGGRDLGEFFMAVEFTRRFHRSCIVVRAHSRGEIDGCPCGTTVTAYLSAEMEVLEEQQHEYVKLQDHSVEKRFHIVQRDGELRIQKVTSVGKEVTKERVSYSTSALRGLMTEGSSLLLMRLLAFRRNAPHHMAFISFDKDLHISSTTFRTLGEMYLDVWEETLEVFGVERVDRSLKDSPTTWQCHFLSNGHLASRVQLGSPITMTLPQPISQKGRGPDIGSIPWEEDVELKAMLLCRKVELKGEHSSYLRRHPEIRALLEDFLQYLLLKKPDDIFHVANEYFLTLSATEPPGGDLDHFSL